MRFLVFGVGAIGTYIGGSLALQGHEVVFVERPGMLDVLQDRGLHLKLADGEHHIENPLIVENVADALGQMPFDAAILAVKSYDTQALMTQLSEHQMRMPVVLCLQNGVENEELIGNALGLEKVIRGTVTTAIGRRGLGDIVVERLRGLGIANESPIAPALVDAFTAAGLNARLFENGKAMKWSKMLTNLPANATSAILNWTAAQVYAHKDVFHLEILLLREALAVMTAQNIPVVNLPGTPAQALSWATKIPEVISQPLLLRALGKGRGGKMPSFHIDLYSGSGKSEVAYLNGAVVRYGEKMRIATIVNAKLTEILLGITRGEISKEVYASNPDKLVETILKS